MPDDSPIQRCLLDLDAAKPGALSRLFEVANEELTRQARAIRRGDQAVSETHALVNDLVVTVLNWAGEHPDSLKFAGPGRFFSFTSKALRHIVLNKIRHGRAQKRGAGMTTNLGDRDIASAIGRVDGFDIRAALDDLCHEDRRAWEVAEHKLFSSLGHDEIAAVLDMTPPQVERDWTFARARLRQRLESYRETRPTSENA